MNINIHTVDILVKLKLPQDLQVVSTLSAARIPGKDQDGCKPWTARPPVVGGSNQLHVGSRLLHNLSVLQDAILTDGLSGRLI